MLLFSARACSAYAAAAVLFTARASSAFAAAAARPPTERSHCFGVAPAGIYGQVVPRKVRAYSDLQDGSGGPGPPSFTSEAPASSLQTLWDNGQASVTKVSTFTASAEQEVPNARPRESLALRWALGNR